MSQSSGTPLWKRPVAKRHRLRAIFIALLALPLTLAPWSPNASPIVAPFLQNTTETSLSIVFETSMSTTATVRYGHADLLDASVESESPRRLHTVRISGLKPDTRYLYEVTTRAPNGATFTSPRRSFRTAPSEGRPFSFAVVGDSQDNPSAWGRVARAVFNERPEFVVHCGDLVGDGRSTAQWTHDFFLPAQELFAHVPFFPVLGNHEEDGAPYYRYMDLPAPEHYYRFDWCGARFFMLDSNRDLSEGSAQRAWLERELKDDAVQWKIVVHHHPTYSSDADDFGDWRHTTPKHGDHRMRALIPLLERSGVNLVLYGHIHAYERTWPLLDDKVHEHGVQYVLTGGAGGDLEEFSPNRAPFSARVRRTHHFLMVLAKKSALEVRAVDDEGRVFDHFVVHSSQRSSPASSQERSFH